MSSKPQEPYIPKSYFKSVFYSILLLPEDLFSLQTADGRAVVVVLMGAAGGWPQ